MYMASSICFYAIVSIFLLSGSINGEDKEVHQKEKRQSFPNFNEISLHPSGATNFLYDLLGLRSIPSLDYSIPTLQLPLKLTQKPPESSENKVNLKSTVRPALPLPPPPPAVPPKQQVIPTAQYNQPTAIPYKPPFETLHYPQYQVQEIPKGVPVTAGYNKQEAPLNYRQPVPQFIIIRRPLPSIDNIRQLPAPQQPQPHSLHPQSYPQNTPVTYVGPPRVAVHENYNIQEIPVRQSAPTVIKPQDAQITQNEQVIRGPRYYLPQPTKGHDGYFGPFQFAPGSFDALLKSDISFLDHLSADGNKTDNTQSSIKDERYNSHDSQSPQQYQPTTNDKYYKPQVQSNSYSSEGAQFPHTNSDHSTQSVEEKEQPYHKPIPVHDKENEEKEKSVDPTLFDHRHLSPPPQQSGYIERNPVGPVYRIIPQSNPNVIAYQTQPVNNYRTPVPFQAAVQPNVQIVPIAYRPEVQPNYVAQLPYRQQIQPPPYVSYKPQVQTQIHPVNPINNFRQPESNPSQAIINQHYSALPNQAINQPKITIVRSYPNRYTSGRSATGHVVENLENHRIEPEEPRSEIRNQQHQKYDERNYNNHRNYNSEKPQKYEDESRLEKNRDYPEESESDQQTSNDYDKDEDDKPNQYRNYKDKEEYKSQEPIHNHERNNYNDQTRSRDYNEEEEPFDDDSSHRRSKRQIVEQFKTSSNDPSVLKVFRAITINDTEGVLVDQRYVRDKDGKPVHIYTQTQPITYTESSSAAAENYDLPTPEDISKEAYVTPLSIVTETSKVDNLKDSLITHEDQVNLTANEPECAKNSTIPICTSDDHYPKEEILKALSEDENFIRKLSGVTALINSTNVTSNGQVSPTAENKWENICPSVISQMTPLRARNLKGEWKIIVNVEEIKQNLNIETCLKLGERCNLVPVQFQTQCDQKYAILHLLTYEKNVGLMVDQFLVPAACSCSVVKSSE